ncbi:hypothetical protein [Amycolatopsis sacchari]|uniref:hypothetical protein n=1 Tax=Amycolatopsis sacchari TaxID=115433 RepID=UPI003EB8433D
MQARIVMTRAILGLSLLLVLTACGHTENPGPAPLDLATVDWAEAVVPGDLCLTPQPVQLHDGTATVVDEQWGNLIYSLGDRRPTYGDLTGDGQEEAGIDVYCVPEGAGGSAVISRGFLIFDGSSGAYRSIGAITAVHPRAPGLAQPFVESIEIEPGRITAHEKFFAESDPSCCPGNDAVTTWTFDGTSLTHGPAAVG